MRRIDGSLDFNGDVLAYQDLKPKPKPKTNNHVSRSNLFVTTTMRQSNSEITSKNGIVRDFKCPPKLLDGFCGTFCSKETNGVRRE